MIPMWIKFLGLAAAGKVLLDALAEDEDQDMYNCHDYILAYHDENVTLPESEQREMRDRRNTNRQRSTNGLHRDERPEPIGYQSQGSYAHRTMVQHKDKDYDIDDGVYFWKDDLKGPNGGGKSPGQAKEMVRKALHDGRFNQPPEVRTNCVRVYYNAGYHVDVPVYRKVKTTNDWGEKEIHYELASTEWKISDPAEVTRWFKRENERQSPDTASGRQLRRITRLSKAFARSRESWRPRIASGFMITTLLVDECYRANPARDDKALYDTMEAMRNRLDGNLEIKHPTVEDEMLTSGSDDARAKLLREKLGWAIGELDVLFDPSCTRGQALKAWDKVFNTTFFSARQAKEASSPAVLIAGSEEEATRAAVDKLGGGRYA